jgi:hypothetical protein
MIRAESDRVVITLKAEDPKKLITEIRLAITTVASVLVESDEFNYNGLLPEAIATLIRMQGELISEED